MASTPTAAAQRPALVDHCCLACDRLLLRARLPGESRVEIRCKRCKATIELRGTRVRLVGSCEAGDVVLVVSNGDFGNIWQRLLDARGD